MASLAEITGNLNNWISNNQALIGAAGTITGLGTKIGSAVRQAKANRLAMRAANQQNASAREALADAENPLANQATQAALNAGEQQLSEEQAAAEKQNAVMGATPEMQLAQRQQGLKTLADMYASTANGAYGNYVAAQQAADNAAINPLLVRQQALQQSAQQLNTAADNLLRAGNKSMTGVK